MSAICSKATAQAVTLNPEQGMVKRRLPLIIPGRPSQQSQIRGAVAPDPWSGGGRKPASSWKAAQTRANDL